MRIGSKEISGVTVDIHASHTGMFTIYPSGETTNSLGFADTLEKAIAQARPKIAQTKVRVEVPFITYAGERGIATGLHASNRSVLARIDGKAVQLNSYAENRVFRADMPDDRLARYRKIDEEVKALNREAFEIETEFGIKLNSVVQRAIDEATKEQPDA